MRLMTKVKGDGGIADRWTVLATDEAESDHST